MTLRCIICGWPLASRREDGCVPGDCSYRPREGSDEWVRIQRRRAELQCSRWVPTKDNSGSLQTKNDL